MKNEGSRFVGIARFIRLISRVRERARGKMRLRDLLEFKKWQNLLTKADREYYHAGDENKSAPAPSYEVISPHENEFVAGPLQLVVRLKQGVNATKAKVSLNGQTYPGIVRLRDCVFLLPTPAGEVVDLNLMVVTDNGGVLEDRLFLRIKQPGPGYQEGVYELIEAKTKGLVLKREHIYGAGPPNEAPDGETLGLIREYGGSPMLDVGCGVGAYISSLRDGGFHAVGIETNPSYVLTAKERGLNVELYDGNELPFPDRAFNTVIAVEVLEHVGDWESLLMEMIRVAERRVLVTTPDIGVLTGMARHGVVPWHILESTHVNFFTTEVWRHIIRRIEGVNGFAFSFGERIVNDDAFKMHVFALFEQV